MSWKNESYANAAKLEKNKIFNAKGMIRFTGSCLFTVKQGRNPLGIRLYIDLFHCHDESLYSIFNNRTWSGDIHAKESFAGFAILRTRL